MRSGLWLLCSLVLLANCRPIWGQSADAVLARVNGQPILAVELQLAQAVGQLPANPTTQEREAVLEQLIDRELIRQHLASRKLTATPAQVAEQVGLIRAAISQRGGQPDEVLAKLKLDDRTLGSLISVSAGWSQSMGTVITADQIRAEWNSRKQELDGTRLKGAQIVRLLPADAPAARVEQETALLTELRSRIVAGQLSFAEAARANSQSPSAARGGDLGEFEYRGRVDEEISRAAFGLKPGEVSPPFRTRLGIHLVTVSERIPGQLSQEDARQEIVKGLSRQKWDEVCRQARLTARIERVAN